MHPVGAEANGKSTTGKNVFRPFVILCDLVANVEFLMAVERPARQVLQAQVDRQRQGATGLGVLGDLDVLDQLAAAIKQAELPIERKWWHTATVYQVYPRSFQDADGSTTLAVYDALGRPDYIVPTFDTGLMRYRFLVDDTGKNVIGHTLDIWTPNCREARRFGRRQRGKPYRKMER